MEKPRVVIDTNVIVSILKGSQPLSFIYTAFKEDRFKRIIPPKEFMKFLEL